MPVVVAEQRRLVEPLLAAREKGASTHLRSS
jgi:hypothetical protein